MPAASSGDSRGLIEARDLWFTYADGPAALCGVSVTIEAGRFTAILGQNGSGKTTLAKHFNGLLKPSSGEVLLRGQDIRERSLANMARTVGYVFQNPDHQIFSASVRAEIEFGPRNLGLTKAEVEERTADAMALFDLAAHADLPPATLGFGLRRKVSLAAVYSMRPEILILDEPTSGLDHASVRGLMTRLVQLNEAGHTVLIISHDMRLVTEYAQECVLLQAGKVLAHEPTRTLFSQGDLLQTAKINPPQIIQLAQRLAPLGVDGDILTVEDFCRSYGRLLGGVERPGAGLD